MYEYHCLSVACCYNISSTVPEISQAVTPFTLYTDA